MSADRRLTVALEEYQGVRSEQVARISAQSQLLAPIVALLMFVGAVAPELRQYIPLLVLPLSLAYASHRFWVNHLGQYIREVIWSTVKDEAGYKHSFEAFTEQQMWRWGGRRWTMQTLEAGIPLLLVMLSVGMMLAADPLHTAILVLDIIAVILTALSMPFSVYASKPRLEDEGPAAVIGPQTAMVEVPVQD